MANAEQLKIIRGDVEAWNKYVLAQGAVFRAALKDADLTDADLRGAELGSFAAHRLVDARNFWEADLPVGLLADIRALLFFRKEFSGS